MAWHLLLLSVFLAIIQRFWRESKSRGICVSVYHTDTPVGKLFHIKYCIVVSQQCSEGGDPITKKVGRPYSENPKEIRLTIRLDKKHNAILEEHSRKNGISKNESVRQGIEMLEDKKEE